MFNSNIPLTLPTETVSKGLTFSKLISGASKTLSFVNNAIPVYYQTKPLFHNAKTLIKAFRKVNSSTTTTTNHKDNVIKKKEQNNDDILYTSLTIFQ